MGRHAAHISVTESVITAKNDLLGPIMPSSIPVYTYSNTVGHPKDSDEPPLAVVMSNGAFKRRGTVDPFIGAYLLEAAEAGRPVEFITYGEPGAFAEHTAAERVRRFSRVVVQTLEAKPDHELHLIGHSIGATDALNVAYALQKTVEPGSLPEVKAVTLLTPVGYAGGRQPQSVWEIAVRAEREASHVRGMLAGLGSVAVLGSLLGSMSGQFVSSPLETAGMVSRAFQADNTARFAEIYGDAEFSVSALLAANDAFYPADATAQTLIGAGLPANRIGRLNHATHLSTVTDYRNGAETFCFMNAQRSLFMARDTTSPSSLAVPAF